MVNRSRNSSMWGMLTALAIVSTFLIAQSSNTNIAFLPGNTFNSIGDGDPPQPMSAESGLAVRFGPPVLTPGPAPWDSMGNQWPFVMKENGLYRMWYIGHSSTFGTVKIGYAESLDGITWVKPFPLPVVDIEPGWWWANGEIGYHWILKDEGIYKMWFSASIAGWIHYNIGYAESLDGITWTKPIDQPVLQTGAYPAWDYYQLLGPTVLKINELYYMWYYGYGTGGGQIGLATSSDGINWVKHPNNPVLPHGLPGFPDDGYVGGQHTVLYENGEFRMWYTGGGSGHRGYLGVATSPDGVIWTKHYDKIILTSNELGTWDEYTGDAMVIHDGQEYKYWYTGFSNSEIRWRIGYAVSDNIFNTPPTADVGPDQTSYLGNDFILDGTTSSDDDGTIVTYDWDFGDGTSHGTGSTTSHIYADHGTYTVTLTVIDDDGDSSTDTCTVTVLNNPPVADAGSDQATFLLQTTAFDGSGSYDVDGSIASYDWDWGDGTEHSSGVTNEHLYADHGTYTVTLTVTDDDGDTDTDTCTITVLNNPPTADAGDDRTLIVGETASFDGSGSCDIDGSIATYDWDWGDGTTHGSVGTATHAYSSPGTYTVTLTVTDDDGDTDTDTLTVTVLTPSEAIDVLIGIKESMGLEQGIETSLDAKLDAAKKSLANGNDDTAVNQLEAFINEVEAQRGKKLTEEQADILVDHAQWIIDNI